MSLKKSKDFIDEREDVYNTNEIINCIRNSFLTKKGSIPGRPEYGSRIYSYLFEPLDAANIDRIKTEAQRVISIFENRVQLLKTEIEVQEEFNRIVINLYIRFHETFEDQKISLVF